jgi:hypothetical protein
MLKWGASAKRDVDLAVDVCGRVHNLRDSILKSFDKAETARHADRHAMLNQQAAEHLKRYFYLICFQAYLLSVPVPPEWSKGVQRNPPPDFKGPIWSVEGLKFAYTFSEWLESRPELSRLAEMTASSLSVLQEPRITDVGGIALGKVDPELAAIENVISARRYSVLGPGTILKSEFFPRHAETALHKALIARGMPNFRRLAEFPVSALAQPSVGGIKGVLTLLGAAPSSAASAAANVLLSPTVTPLLSFA